MSLTVFLHCLSLPLQLCGTTSTEDCVSLSSQKEALEEGFVFQTVLCFKRAAAAAGL